MDDYRYSMMLSFQNEMEKSAVGMDTLRSLGGFLRQQAGAVGAGTGVGALGGGLLGAGIQGTRGYQQAKEQGATTREALLAGAGKGLKGAGTGAAIGAGVGGAAGLAGGQTARDLAAKAVKGGTWNPVAASARMGQRQLHSLTGYADAGTREGRKQLQAMRAGSYGARQRSVAARQRMEELWGKPGASAQDIRRGMQEVQRAQKGLQAARKAESMDLTSLPGYLKSLATNPVETLKAGVGEQWHGSGLGGKLMMAGFPAAAVAGELATPSHEEGPGRLERTGKALAGGLAFGAAPIPLSGMSLLSGGADRLGGLVGAGGDTLLARRRAAQQVAQ